MSEIFTTPQAKASDAELVRLLAIRDKASRERGWAVESAHSAAGDRKRGWGQNAEWTLSFADVEAKLAAGLVSDQSWAVRESQKQVDKLAATKAALDAANAAVRVHDKEWFEHGRWTRFGVVPGGHIHWNHGCHSLYPTTLFFWIPRLSGETVADAIEEYGPALCTHCFKDAPVGDKSAKVEQDAAGNPLTKAEAAKAKADRAAEKAAKQAAKDAKKVFEPGTRKLVVGTDGYELNTEVSVSRAILAALEDIRYYGADKTHYSGTRKGFPLPTFGQWVTYAVAALAAKRGVDEAELLAEFKAKDAKKARRG